MKNMQMAIVYGVFVWLVPFVAGFLLFAVKDALPVLFDTIMSIMVAVAAAHFGLKFLRSVESISGADGLKTGLLWMAICIAIDLPIFVLLNKMPWLVYAKDIGLTYAMIPVITYVIAKAMQPQPQLQ